MQPRTAEFFRQVCHLTPEVIVPVSVVLGTRVEFISFGHEQNIFGGMGSTVELVTAYQLLLH